MNPTTINLPAADIEEKQERYTKNRLIYAMLTKFAKHEF